MSVALQPAPIDLRGVDAKIVRAHVHLATLESEIRSYLGLQIAQFPSKLDRNHRAVLVSFDLLIEPPIPLSIIAGDVVHNARTSLDHLWAALTGSSDSKFPCIRDPQRWKDSNVAVLCRVPKGAHALVETLQPCSGTNDGELLGLLNELSNRDKHRMINVTVTRAVQPRVILSSKRTHESAQFDLGEPFYPNTDRIFTDLTDALMDGGVDVKVQGRFVVAFRDAPLTGRNIRDLLNHIMLAIETRIVPALRQFVKP